MTEFQDIRIVELNDSASGSVKGPLTSMVLQLSADTPTAWSDSFNETWKGRASVMRRAATACGNRIMSACMPYELQSQITELNKVVAETNASYREIVEQAAARQEAELKHLKATLKYD
ncbi:hypothetical protein FHS26_006339 [Rhizobium pisi]|uniref:Uncharacterized protein n=1 Tax=Rhizobium pisi TaxID=574561 RepID=A0A3R9BLL4_9HYPH|nr:hypothetical protein [Rhizobium pisi]MBB3138561.1 hypothetical protein [Rhizobium pisi]RSB62416.1 hypothetical protein EFD55_29690 [Rhizobium pisi]TCA45464.1 hypothetical protein E0J16_29845 [Rhizobium pisi]